MARRRPRKLSGSDRFVLLPHYMLKSSAWKSLSPNAKALLLEVWVRHNGFNNGEISYAVREAEAIGMHHSTASRAFDELIEKNFLRVTRDSAFHVKTRHARLWEITAEGCDGKPASKDFMRWSPPDKN
jgi:hypothetical protein